MVRGLNFELSGSIENKPRWRRELKTLRQPCYGTLHPYKIVVFDLLVYLILDTAFPKFKLAITSYSFIGR
jgi:hypothetical protein